MTYNIRGGLGMDNRRSLSRIAKTISGHQPDIICLQEVYSWVPWKGFCNQPAVLGRLLEMRICAQYNVRFGLGGYGIALASPLPIVGFHQHALPSYGEKRGCLEAHLATPGGTIAVLNTHWGLNQEERALQAKAVAKIVKNCLYPIVLCGDLNESPNTGNVGSLLKAANLLDCGLLTDLNTYPADRPRSRIDYIFRSPEFELMDLEVIESQNSDHLPVVCDLTAFSAAISS